MVYSQSGTHLPCEFQYCTLRGGRSLVALMTSEIAELSLFQILSLPEPAALSPVLPRSEIQKAYKRALLLHHPDKFSQSRASTSRTALEPTVDQIKSAYLTLSSPSEQRAYVKRLLLSGKSQPTGPEQDLPKPEGLETVDLDDMNFDELTGYYFRPCRCGREKSYCISEAQLEERVEDGEVRIGCEGCSLHVVVEFGVVDHMVER